MEKTETVFADGLIAKLRENQPDFVICSLSVKVEDFVKFLNENHDNGWVNIQVLKSKAGKPYCSLDTWKPKAKEEDDLGF